MRSLPSYLSSGLWWLWPHFRAFRHGIGTTDRSILDKVILNPIVNTINIAALVLGVEVCKWVRNVFDPVVRNNSHVAITQNILAEYLNAVAWDCQWLA